MVLFISCASKNKTIDLKEAHSKNADTIRGYFSINDSFDVDFKKKETRINLSEKVSFQINSDADSFCVKYPKACAAFIENFYENRELYNEFINSKNGLDLNFVISIVSPEISYYSSINNKIETLATEAFYVQLGSDYGDFSIGKFQMKPSFVELLESKLFDFPQLNKLAENLKINAENSLEVRKTRISRLKDPSWQLTYLCAFSTYLDYKYRKVSFKTKKDKLLFYASAYNTGFDKPFEEIEKYISKRFFPNGASEVDNNFSYAYVALLFYDKLINFNSKNA